MAKKKIFPKSKVLSSKTLIALIVLIVISIYGYKLNQIREKQKEEAYISSLNPCTKLAEGVLTIAKENGQIFLRDLTNNYGLDLTNLPDIKFSEKPECGERGYELELYKKRNETGFLGSVARVNFTPASRVENNPSLEDIAKNKFSYIEGKHASPNGDNYGQPFTSTPLEKTTLTNGVQLLTWENIYTDQPTHTEGTTAAKQYLLLVNDYVYAFNLFSWDIPSFNKAVNDFDPAIKSFHSIIN